MQAPSTLRRSEWPPDYVSIWQWRQQQILRIRSSDDILQGAKAYYAQPEHAVDFINHWCDTVDPRNAGTPKPVRMPFILFERQAELIEFLLGCLRDEENGLVEKARDMGATWGCVSVSVWLWLFWPGSAIGWGSRKSDLVDVIGDPKSIFEKIRLQIRGIPREFWPPRFNPDRDMGYMKVINPDTEATITGETGDNIGRGGRSLIYFKDESAHYERAEKIEAALADNTRVQIDISSVNGVGNVFHRRRESGADWAPGKEMPRGKTRVMVMDWRDHPEKTQEWYDLRREKARDEGLLHVFAQEIDRNYAAAVEGVIIPGAWVKAAIDAHKVLGFDDSGLWCAALDVADENEGGDLNALGTRKGVVVKTVEEWGDRDTGETTRRAVDTCSSLGMVELQYDCIGVGAGVKAESNRLLREKLMPKSVLFVPWNAGDEVMNKDDPINPRDRQSPLNGDLFANLKAQGWWYLARRFEKTFRAVQKKNGVPSEQSFTWTPDELISLSSEMPLLRKLEKELSQPTMSKGARMKMVVDKTPDGTRSPNLADVVMMMFWPQKARRPMQISSAMVDRSRTLGARR